MSILEELKKEAEKIKSSGEHRLTPEEESALFYEEKLRPAVINIYSYVNELIDQLKIIKPEIHVDLVFPGVESFSVRQSKAVVNINSVNKPDRVSVTLYYVAENLHFRVTNEKAIYELRNFLIANKITSFEERITRDTDNNIIGTSFNIIYLKLSGSLIFLCDRKARSIRVNMSSFIKNEGTTNLFNPEAIDDEWLNQLGLFIAGKSSSPLHTKKTQLTDTQLESIRERIEREKEEEELRKIQMENIEIFDAPANVEDKIKSAFNKLKIKL